MAPRTITTDFSELESPLSDMSILFEVFTGVVGYEMKYRNGRDSLPIRFAGENAKLWFSLSPDEHIVAFFEYSTTQLWGIQFLTNHGRLSSVYGSATGTVYMRSGNSWDARRLVGAKTFTMDEKGKVDAEWIWGVIKTPTDARYLYQGTSIYSWHGFGTSSFNTLGDLGNVNLARLVAINIWYHDGDLDAIQLEWSNGFKSPRYGGAGGDHKSFVLAADENIIQINGTQGNHVNGLTFITNKRSSDHFGSHAGEYVSSPVPRHTSVPLSLLAFVGNVLDGKIHHLAPIWANEGPIENNLTIDEIDGSIYSSSKPISSDKINDTVKNDTKGTIEESVTWKYTATKATSVTLTDSGSWKLGSKFSYKYTIAAKGKLPLIGEGDTKHEAGIEVVLENVETRTTTNTETTTTTKEQTLTHKVSVPPRTAVKGFAAFIRYEARDLRWRGTLTSKWAGGQIKKEYVSGTLTATNDTEAIVDYKDIPLTQFSE